MSRELVAPEFGEPVVLIPQWNMLLWAYPNDPRLRGLAELSSPEKVLSNMQAMPAGYGIPEDHKPVSIQAQLTKYVPSQRCGSIFRVKLDSPDGVESEHCVYGKAYRTQAGPAAFDIACQVWDSEPRRRGELFLAEPISYDEDRHIFWQGALAGRSLAKTATGDGLVDVAEEIGRRLASFHTAELDLPLKRTFAAQCADLTKSVEVICSNYPDHADRCSAMHERLRAQVELLGSEQRTPVHGSFKFSHIFLGDGRVSFIDFDGATLGDPTYDVGRFIAHVAEMQASSKMPAMIAEQTMHRFTSGYLDNTALPMSEDRIRWFTASLIVSSQVAKAVKRFDPALIGKLMTLAESIAPDA
jgi:thiamine kinase-like enzyme